MKYVGVFKVMGNHSSTRVSVLNHNYTPENLQACIDYVLACRMDSNKPSNVRTYEVGIW